MVEEVINRHFTSFGVEYRRYETSGNEEDLPAVLRQAIQNGAEIVLAAGGDGTVSAVADGLAYSGTPMGIIPTGSGNTLARELNIPLEIQQALELITGEHRLRALDTILVGDRHFVLNLSIGLSSRIVAETERRQKRKLGKAAYFFQGLQNLAGLRLQNYFLAIDERKITARASEVYIANAGLIGLKPLRLSPEIKPDDGILHVCVFRARTFGDFAGLLLSALLGRPDRQPELTCFAAQGAIQIDSNAPRLVQGDGDLIGQTPIEIGIARAAIEFLVPISQR